jgi:tRNA (guanine-N7-)-methyltransferase
MAKAYHVLVTLDSAHRSSRGLRRARSRVTMAAVHLLSGVSMSLPVIISARPIRSFVLRQGRITRAQQQALEELWPLYGMAPEIPLTEALFPRAAPLVLEIGFGNGESLAQMALADPARNFVGIEVHRPGVGHLLRRIQELGLDNLRVYCSDAVEILRDRVVDASLSGIQVFFPDPWHKKRHHKRRLVNREFVQLATRKLAPGGVFHGATDWEDYALQMLEVLEADPDLRNRAGKGGFSERPEHRPPTKFEDRGHRLGHGVWDLMFEKAGM